MQPITAPISRDEPLKNHSAIVTNLQEGLLLLLRKKSIQEVGELQQFFEEGLQKEQRDQAYNQITEKFVRMFQEQYKQRLELFQPFFLIVSGNVDAATAAMMNRRLFEMDALRSVEGRVTNRDGSPVVGNLLFAFDTDNIGGAFLGSANTNADGAYQIFYDPLLYAQAGEGVVKVKGVIDLIVQVNDVGGATLAESQPLHDPGHQALVDLRLGDLPEGKPFTVNGTVSSRSRAGVGTLRIDIVDKNVGVDVGLAKTATDDAGSYQVTFTISHLEQRSKQQPDLQARVFIGDIFLGASEVRYNASNRETLNVLLDETAASALPAEHETLTGALTAHCHVHLRDLKETGDRQDITYLANKTGWDARAVALAALADQFSARTTDANNGDVIEPAFFYALFRAGVPANDAALYQTDAKTAEAIWKQAIEQGVISKQLENRLSQARERFQSLAVQRALDTPALAGVSSLKEMLSVSLGDDPARQQQFAALYTQHRTEPDKLWAAVRDNFGEAVEKRLQLDGQLAYLTLNNSLLIRKLHDAAGQDGLTQTLDLVDQGFHRADKWKEVIGNGAIPPEIRGKDDADKRMNYAELMAAQVRLSFPTAVVAEAINGIETPAANLSVASSFLREHHSKFEIGMQPVEQYISRNNLQVAEKVTQAVKQVQRVYQITPSDSAMTGLLKKGIDSAYAVTLYDRDDFIRMFKDDIGGEENAVLTYAKSQQVHNAVLNIATSYLIAKSASPIGVHSPPQIVAPAPDVPAHAGDVIAYPTLESLFGEMDYCACEHCRSILSPAAYLMSLLQFIDLKRYNSQGVELPAAYEGTNPLDVLLERRPDIQYLPLTCENTNAALPYIDLVNETLEYFIFNKLSLEQYEGHNTDGDATPEELLASPQFGDTTASTEAYKLLAAAHFPPPLPFHQPLEYLRRYFDRFEAPLTEILEALRKDDNLDRANDNEYGWRDILMEELRLSRAEHALLSERTLTLQQVYGYPEATLEADILSSLSNAKAFTRRMNISYEDIIDILHTRFVNPNSTLVPKLERLHVPFVTLKKLKDGMIADADFDKLLPQGLDVAQYGGDIKAWVRNEANYANIMSLITLADPAGAEDIYSFDKLEFRYSDPDKIEKPIRAVEFYRLIRFIRLWKKLGWTIEQTDKTITALYPADQTPNDADNTVNLQRLDAGFLILLPRLGVIKRVMKALSLKPKDDLLPLLACFAPIDTHGAVSLYRQMFLSPALLKQAPVVADNGYGSFLMDKTQKLLMHTETLRAAFQLTDDELGQITSELGYDANTSLTVDNISSLFRRSWLARKLKLSVREFLLLTRFTGFDPFAVPDAPNAPILRLIEMVTRLRLASLKPVQALYLIWNQDISGKSAPDDDEVLGFGRTLRAGFAAIESEFVIVDDPDGQIARAKMALVYDNDATNRFFGLLDDKTVTDVPYSHDQTTLDQAILDAGQGKVAYDNLRKRLSYTGGVLPDAIRDALKGVPGVTKLLKEAVGELQKKSRALFDRFSELLPLYNTYVASNELPEKKRSTLLGAILSTLKPRRKRQQALQAISAAAKSDIGFANALLDNKLDGKHVLHMIGDVTQPALNDFTALETPGLSTHFFFRDTATGKEDRTSDTEANLDYSSTAKDKAKMPDNGINPISGIWSGYLETPENSFYNFYVETDADAVVALTLDGKTIDLVQKGNVRSNTEAVELRAGTLYPLSLTVEKVKNTLTVRWETEGRGREVIPARYLYSATLTDHLRATYVRFLKVVSLAEALKLTGSETVYFASHATYRIADQGWLNSLPITGSPDKAVSTALRKALMALLDFARIKAEVSPDDDERLLTVLSNPETIIKNLTAASGNPELLLLSLTRWEPNSLDALLTRFGNVKDGKADRSALKDLDTFSRVYTAYSVMKKLGLPASALIKAATNEPHATTVRDLQAALRARYEESDWLNVLTPINDEMRASQRDALVAYILHQMRANPDSAHIDTPDKLFEYFLMDVQMAPCMQTSRIRHALSSVQLFIERCLMNLEKEKVSPSSIKAKQWEWMKRYRVWEANRKVFLWPENWLEPELRDDQSPFFKETMSELLQSDITEDSAAVALLNYLSKLDEVAKLEPCGIHYVENDLGTSDDIAHVVARTAGANRKYFYRRREYGYWTPWEHIKLDIEDNPVIPVVWKGRLFLIWLRILKQALLEPPQMPDKSLAEVKPASLVPASLGNVTIQAMLCWSEYYNGKWQPTKTSDVNRPTGLGTSPALGPLAFDRSGLGIRFSEEGSALRIDLNGWSSFLLYNTHSLPQRQEDIGKSTFENFPPRLMDPWIFLGPSSGTLAMGYNPGLGTGDSSFNGTGDRSLYRSVLSYQTRARTVQPSHPLKTPWDSPFFFEDSHHVFFVTTTEQLVTILEWKWFLKGKLPESNLIIPPLVVPPGPIIPDLVGPVITGPHRGVLATASIERFVSEDAYIKKGIGTTGTVLFDGTEIGAAGNRNSFQ